MADDRKPLGEPAPAVSNLALAIIILVVIAIQTAFVCFSLKLVGLDSCIERMARLFDRSHNGFHCRHVAFRRQRSQRW